MAKILIACGSPGKAFSEEVEGKVFGAWAAHESVSHFDEFRVTFIRFGLAVPFRFGSAKAAQAVAKAINALRPDWSDATVATIRGLRQELRALCEQHGGQFDGENVFKGEPPEVASLAAE